MDMEKLALLAFLLITVQGVLSFFQAKNYKNRIAALRRRGVLGIGAHKAAVGRGSMILLVADKAGRIVACEEMKGMTVFSRFKQRGGLEGKNISDLKRELMERENQSGKKKKKKSSLLQAIESIEKQMRKMEEEAEETMEPVR